MHSPNYKEIAKKLDISPKAFGRLIGSTKVNLTSQGSEAVSYELGLRLEKKYLDSELNPAGFSEEQIIYACHEYLKNCPAVYQWLCSGNFENENFSNQISSGNIIHACRTAGRIRASMLR